MKRTSIVLAMVLLGTGIIIAQDTLSFTLKTAQDYAIENSVTNKNARLDIEAAKNKGITVTNIPAYSTDSVAQMVFSHILHFAQNVAAHALSVSEGEWSKSVD